MLDGDEQPHLGFGIGAGPGLQFPNAPHELARSRVGISGDELRIGVGQLDDHTEMMQGFRPSGATSEQLTSNFRSNGLLVWLVTGLSSGSFSNALLSSAQFRGEKPKDTKNFALDAPGGMNVLSSYWVIFPSSRIAFATLGSWLIRMDLVALQRNRAREGLPKPDRVVLAVTINVNDSPFTVLGQHAAAALDGMLESHDAEFRDAAAFLRTARPPLRRTNLQIR
jgi:hypothetical protein